MTTYVIIPSMINMLYVDQEKLKGIIWGQQGKIARKMGIHPVSLSRKINGSQKLSIKEINDLAFHLNRSVCDFVKIKEAQ